MTNEELLQDLKQYIDTSIGQHTAHLATKADLDKLQADLDNFEARVDERFDTVLDAIGERFEPIDDTLKDHERRLDRLERRAA